ncbi:hypothetical protein [Baekduia sp.]|jgi:hypothetical protein|uniref:hypothetical protein n=1 Tax=Baekduia sp. TaxID=2600305 RepID=UPI002E0A1E79|nr:hypothetical protein [Baekduia sp.]
MASLPHQRARGDQAHPETFDVALRMVLEDHLDEDTLVELAMQMNDAIDNHTGDEIAGVDVSGVLSPPTVVIGLDVVAASLTELHAVIAAVVSVIERECPISVVSSDQHVQRADPEPALACA